MRRTTTAQSSRSQRRYRFGDIFQDPVRPSTADRRRGVIMPTPIRGHDQIAAAAALRSIRSASPNDVRPADTSLYVNAIIALADSFDVRSSVLLAQAWHETGGFGPNGRWRELNPAGLGITASGDATPYFLIDGSEAASVHVWSMLVALRDWDRAANIDLPDAANGWKARWTAKYQDAACPQVRNVEDLNLIYSGNRATWATDAAYHTKTIAVLERLFPGGTTGQDVEPTGALAFGRVPHPAYHDRPIIKPEGVGQNNLGKRSVKGVVWHRMLGTLGGTDGWFRRADVKALTDYGVGVASIDGAALDGVIYRWTDPYGYQSGWASGPVIAPWGDGVPFIRKYGINGVNRDQVSIEISGEYGTPLTEAARESVIALTAHYADQYGIPWNEFPIAPQDGFSFVRWHQEFCGPQEKPCPGSEVIAETDALIERIRAVLRHHQTSAGAVSTASSEPAFAPPITYPWLTKEVASEGIDRTIDETPVYYFPSVYVSVERTERNQHAGPDSPPIGPPIESGTRFRADYVFRSRGVSWVLTPYGTRVRAAALLPKIQITTGGTISVRREPGGQPVVVRQADV